MASMASINMLFRSLNEYLATCSPFRNASACEDVSAELFGTFAYSGIL